MMVQRTRTMRAALGVLLVASFIATACAGRPDSEREAATQPPPPLSPDRTVTPLPAGTTGPLPQAPAGEGDSVEPIFVSSERQRELSPPVSQATLSELSAGNRAFALDLYQAIQGQAGNLFYSPYSISVALAMTYAGARGDTAQQMADTLHFSLPQEQLHPAFNGLDLQLVGPAPGGAGSDTQSFTLNIANSLWGQQGYGFLPEFLDLLAENYGAGLRLLDFGSGENREQARLTINQWISDQTQDRIKDLIPQGALTELTRLVLANAIYFKAEWEAQFLNGTADGPFQLLDGEQVTVPMMSRRTVTPYLAGEGFQALELSYKGGHTSMVVLLPGPGQFTSFEGALDAERLAAILQGLQPQDVELFMPKFEYEMRLDLKPILAGMGMADPFDPRQADFSGMDGTRQLYISDVLHKAFVAVNEEGTEAAAATGVVVGITSLPFTVRVDRPFVFLIRDVETDTILFMGRVLNPLA